MKSRNCGGSPNDDYGYIYTQMQRMKIEQDVHVYQLAKWNLHRPVVQYSFRRIKVPGATIYTRGVYLYERAFWLRLDISLRNFGVEAAGISLTNSH